MQKVRVVGAGMTRFGKYLDRGLRDLAEEAVRNAVQDAGGVVGFNELLDGDHRELKAKMLKSETLKFVRNMKIGKLKVEMRRARFQIFTFPRFSISAFQLIAPKTTSGTSPRG